MDWVSVGGPGSVALCQKKIWQGQALDVFLSSHGPEACWMAEKSAGRSGHTSVAIEGGAFPLGQPSIKKNKKKMLARIRKKKSAHRLQESVSWNQSRYAASHAMKANADPEKTQEPPFQWWHLPCGTDQARLELALMATWKEQARDPPVRTMSPFMSPTKKQLSSSDPRAVGWCLPESLRVQEDLHPGNGQTPPNNPTLPWACLLL